MTRVSMRFAMLLAVTCAAWQPSKAFASEEETQFWLNAVATGEIADEMTLTIDASQRFRELAKGNDQRSLRVSIDRRIDEAARIGAGIGVFETGGGFTEIRVHQQAVVNLGRLEARTRLEERFFDGADRMELRLRQRVQYNQPVAEGWRAAAGVEWLGIVQSRNANAGSSTEQWRFQTSLVHRVSKQLDVGAIYWMVVFPRGDQPDRINHIPQATVTWRF